MARRCTWIDLHFAGIRLRDSCSPRSPTWRQRNQQIDIKKIKKIIALSWHIQLPTPNATFNSQKEKLTLHWASLLRCQLCLGIWKRAKIELSPQQGQHRVPFVSLLGKNEDLLVVAVDNQVCTSSSQAVCTTKHSTHSAQQVAHQLWVVTSYFCENSLSRSVRFFRFLSHFMTHKSPAKALGKFSTSVQRPQERRISVPPQRLNELLRCFQTLWQKICKNVTP